MLLLMLLVAGVEHNSGIFRTLMTASFVVAVFVVVSLNLRGTKNSKNVII